jgi:hypothetical protein
MATLKRGEGKTRLGRSQNPNRCGLLFIAREHGADETEKGAERAFRSVVSGPKKKAKDRPARDHWRRAWSPCGFLPKLNVAAVNELLGGLDCCAIVRTV